MLRELKQIDPEMFKNYGPSCFTTGVCPEGRLCCGKQAEMKTKFENLE
jgi:thymidylate synthase (FAD)